ncbi:MAG: NlpC/P60 family protein, partial [Clostridium sp.]|uniref:C40 family peptidase n=1 Tax=Clostridium sp. TaxID=1506 RepID=UPI003F337BC9
RKILAAVIAGSLALNVSMPSMIASAEPVDKEVQAAQDQYEEMQANIAKINDKINSFNSQIEPLVVSIQNNKKQMSDLEKQMENTQKEIEQSKEKIAKQEEVLGNRLSELYKSGGQIGYLELIFGASSFGDLINRVEIATRLITIDKDAVETLKNDKAKLDEQVKSISEKKTKLEELNKQTETELANAEKLKAEQEVLGEQATAAQKEFDKKYLARYERQVVASQIEVLTNSNSSINALKSAISQINELNRSQIKSPTVKAEIEAAVTKGKANLKRKEDEARAQAEAEANRGDGGNGGTSSGGSTGGSTGGTAPPVDSGSAQAVLNEAYRHLGKPYVWGATGPNSFDCSGFTSYVYKKVTGRYIGRTTYDQVNAGSAVSRSQLQPGDLVFTSAGHVGIYVGGGNMIHAPRTGDVIKVSPMWSFYAGRRVL